MSTAAHAWGSGGQGPSKPPGGGPSKRPPPSRAGRKRAHSPDSSEEEAADGSAADDDDDEDDDPFAPALPTQRSATARKAPSKGKKRKTNRRSDTRPYRDYSKRLRGRHLLFLLGDLKRNPCTGLWQRCPEAMTGKGYKEFLAGASSSNPNTKWKQRARKEVPSEELQGPVPEDADEYTDTYGLEPIPPVGSAPPEYLDFLRESIRMYFGNNLPAVHRRHTSATQASSAAPASSRPRAAGRASNRGGFGLPQRQAAPSRQRVGPARRGRAFDASVEEEAQTDEDDSDDANDSEDTNGGPPDWMYMNDVPYARVAEPGSQFPKYRYFDGILYARVAEPGHRFPRFELHPGQEGIYEYRTHHPDQLPYLRDAPRTNDQPEEHQEGQMQDDPVEEDQEGGEDDIQQEFHSPLAPGGWFDEINPTGFEDDVFEGLGDDDIPEGF